jgi:hypothetical protein
VRPAGWGCRAAEQSPRKAESGDEAEGVIAVRAEVHRFAYLREFDVVKAGGREHALNVVRVGEAERPGRSGWGFGKAAIMPYVLVLVAVVVGVDVAREHGRRPGRPHLKLTGRLTSPPGKGADRTSASPARQHTRATGW